jgi:hypothetical protein
MSELAGITTCNLPHPKNPGQVCGQRFAGPQHLIIGEGAPGRMKTLLEKLVMHLHTQHPEYFAQVMIQGEEYKGLLWVMAFQTSDPELQQQRDYLRWSIHQRTLNASLSDEKLRGAVDQIANNIWHELQFWLQSGQKGNLLASISRILTPELQAIRDALQEPVAPPNPLAPQPAAVAH